MQTIIKIEKEDIITCRIGCNIQIVIDEKLQIVFSREALDELVNDYDLIKIQEDNNKLIN